MMKRFLPVAMSVFLAAVSVNAQQSQPAKKPSKASKAAKPLSPPPVPPPDFTLEPKAMDILKAACSRCGGGVHIGEG
jgi:hypothetical protein